MRNLHPMEVKRLAQDECFAAFETFLTKSKYWDSNMYQFLRQLCESALTMDDAFSTLNLLGLNGVQGNGVQGNGVQDIIKVRLSYFIFKSRKV